MSQDENRMSMMYLRNMTETGGNSDVETAEPELHSPIDLPSIPDVVSDALRRDIGRGIYKPGPIRVRAIAERFGVSATPVREALRRLEAEGLVSLRNRQIVVNALSVQEMHEIYRIRAELEAFAVRQAAPHVHGNEEVLSRLDSLVEAMDRNEHNPENWRAGNEEFHMLLYSFSEMPRLRSIINQLWVAVEPYLRLYVSTAKSFRAAQEQHRSLVRHLRAGEFDEAAQVMREHLWGTEELLARGLGEAEAG
jgi:DNA-binding GntR family transcriptional regulator